MEIGVHTVVFVLSAGVIWFFSGLLLDSTTTIAKRFNRKGFAVAFLILGLITSISELSVAINASLGNVPQVSAGNLIGASFVIFFFIIPFLAIVGKGITFTSTFKNNELILALGVILLPALFALDGTVTRAEGLLMVAVYILLLLFIQRKEKGENTLEIIIEERFTKKFRTSIFDLTKIIGGGALIFFASKVLVQEAVYFSDAWRVPGSFIGLLILSLGTNVPEIVIAARAVIKKHKEIALGDYMGSAAANTLLFGGLALFNHSFVLAREEFQLIALFLAGGFIFFYFFSRSGHMLSRREGVLLLIIYICFVAFQLLVVPQTPPSLER